MRPFIGLVVCLCAVALFGSGSVAQDAKPGTVSFNGYGESVQVVAARMAKQLGYTFVEPGGELEAMELPVWMAVTDRAPASTAELLRLASGCPVSVDSTRKEVRLDWDAGAEQQFVKGYDVSVISNEYVRYVNQYGRARQPEDKAVGIAASEHLAELLEATTWLRVRVVGDRLIVRTHAAGHSRIQELLELMRADHGGESEALRNERELWQKLESKKISIDVEETPVFSVVSVICRQAGVDFAVRPGAHHVSEEHVDFTATDETALAALTRLLGGFELHVGTILGAVTIDAEPAAGAALRVYELSGLLKKMADAYAKQQTKPHEGGFTGDFRDAGGVDVVTNTLFELLLEDERNAEVRSFGGRLIVRGSVADCAFIELALKEMGWTP